MRKVDKIKARLLSHTKGHIRTTLGPDEELRPLGESFLANPINPVIYRPDFEVVDGNRRLAGVLLVAGGEAELLGCLTDEEVTPSFRIDIALESALHVRSLSPYEQFLGYSEWLKAHAGATAKDLAARIRKDPAGISRTLSLERCLPAVVEAAAAGRLTVSDWHPMSQLPAQAQHELLAMKLTDGASRDVLTRESRKRRQPAGDNAKASSIRIKLASGLAVSISGSAITLDSAIEAAGEAGRELERGRKQGYTAKTISQMAAERAKASANPTRVEGAR